MSAKDTERIEDKDKLKTHFKLGIGKYNIENLDCLCHHIVKDQIRQGGKKETKVLKKKT